MIEKWETLETKKVDNFKIFDLMWITRQNKNLNKKSNFVVLDSPQWVNIIPITKDNNVILIEQYRQGIDDLTIEIPGGLIEQGESPQQAGMRECKEETGYTSDLEAILLGIHSPNPAFLNNKCYSYVWFNCEKTDIQNLDSNEDIRVFEIPINEVNDWILSGKINHSLVLSAFFFYFLKYSKL